MKHRWWIACLVLSLLSAFSAPARALDLSATLHFIDEPGLVLHEAFTLRLKHYAVAHEEKPIAEEYYVGYIDDTGLVRKLLQKETYWNPSTSFEEEVVIRKTSDGYYYEILSILLGKEYSRDHHHYRLDKDGFTITTQRKFLSEEIIQLNGAAEKTTTKTITYMHDNGYLWQSDYKRAKIEDNQYFEHYYTQNENMWDNIIYADNTISSYYEYDQDTNKPLLKYKYLFPTQRTPPRAKSMERSTTGCGTYEPSSTALRNGNATLWRSKSTSNPISMRRTCVSTFSISRSSPAVSI